MGMLYQRKRCCYAFRHLIDVETYDTEIYRREIYWFNLQKEDHTPAFSYVLEFERLYSQDRMYFFVTLLF